MIPPELLSYLVREIPLHLDWVNTAVVDDGLVSPQEFVVLWCKWAALHNFIKLFGTPQEPKGYLIARPVRMDWVFDADTDYFKTLFQFDPTGEVFWLDTLWARGLYQEVVAFIRSTKKPYVAWSHGKRLYFKRVCELWSGHTPSKSEIEECFVRFV